MPSVGDGAVHREERCGHVAAPSTVATGGNLAVRDEQEKRGEITHVPQHRKCVIVGWFIAPITDVKTGKNRSCAC